MDRFSEHFLDSNIIIGAILHWDHSHSDCCDYFDNCVSTKNASERVYIECETVLGRLRRIQKNFILELNEYAQTKDITYPDRILRRFITKYVQDNYSTLDISEDKFKDILNEFTGQCYSYVVSAMTDYLTCMSFLSKIDEAFSNALNQLNSTCFGSDPQIIIHKFTISYNSIFPTFIEKLKNFGIHKSDRYIILDCHFLVTNIFQTNMAFITSDNKILKTKKDVESLLQGTYIFEPIIP